MDLNLDVGSVFAGRYRIVRPIARGGMGAVYEVIHLETERRRAMKVILPTALKSDEARDRFKREAKVGAIIDSEFVVDVFDAGIDTATQMPFMVMELLKGEELGVRIERAGPLSPQEVVTYLHQTALALDKSHRASVIHRDIKPENLYLTEREDGPPRVKVLDFGIAKLLADGGLTVNATRSIGTPRYMAPEQFHGGVVISAATDIYALVHVAYTLLVGVAYYEDEANTESGILGFAMAVSRGPQEPPSQRAARRRRTLPPGFDAWFFQGTAIQPERRFATATEAIAHLADAMGVARPAGGSAFAPTTGPQPRLPQRTGSIPARTELSDGPYFAASATQTGGPPKSSLPLVAAGIGGLFLAIAVVATFVVVGRGDAGKPSAAVAATGAPTSAATTAEANPPAVVPPESPPSPTTSAAPSAPASAPAAPEASGSPPPPARTAPASRTAPPARTAKPAAPPPAAPEPAKPAAAPTPAPYSRD